MTDNPFRTDFLLGVRFGGVPNKVTRRAVTALAAADTSTGPGGSAVEKTHVGVSEATTLKFVRDEALARFRRELTRGR
jgi:hypothetical protein